MHSSRGSGHSNRGRSNKELLHLTGQSTGSDRMHMKSQRELADIIAKLSLLCTKYYCY